MKISTVVSLTSADMYSALKDYMVKNGVPVPEESNLKVTPDFEDYQVTIETGASDKPTKKARLSPKEAVTEMSSTYRAADKTPDAAVEHLGAVKTSEVVNKEPPPVAAEAPPFDVTTKTATLTATTETTAPGAKEDAKDGTPASAAKSSLIAGFKRPSNG
jgi:hypothetical protein